MCYNFNAELKNSCYFSAFGSSKWDAFMYIPFIAHKKWMHREISERRNELQLQLAWKLESFSLVVDVQAHLTEKHDHKVTFCKRKVTIRFQMVGTVLYTLEFSLSLTRSRPFVRIAFQYMEIALSGNFHIYQYLSTFQLTTDSINLIVRCDA